MECYNKVIFFYKLQLKVVCALFHGYSMMYNRCCTSIACVIISVQFLLLMLAVLCLHIVTDSWNNNVF